MKTKKFSRKLMLNKKTVANLNGNLMGRVRGGYQNTQTDSCCLVHTDCPDCTQTCNCPTDVTCATCATCQTCRGCKTFFC
jgi:hypothetical protein